MTSLTEKTDGRNLGDEDITDPSKHYPDKKTKVDAGLPSNCFMNVRFREPPSSVVGFPRGSL